MGVSREDKIFIAELLEDELEYEMLNKLDEKLKDSEFKAAYQIALDEKYDKRSGKVLGYLPMIILIVLVVLGIVLIMSKV